MARGYFNWKPEDVIRFLKDYKFSWNHTRGSHAFYVGFYAGKFRQVCIPFHGQRELKPRTLKSIILQSGIPKEKWLSSS
jgi:predicted RNA binding protein YcfA (HicA-like mRNA interferase family)